jgi:hypothetical protein
VLKNSPLNWDVHQTADITRARVKKNRRDKNVLVSNQMAQVIPSFSIYGNKICL